MVEDVVLRVDCDLDELVQIVEVFGGDDAAWGEGYSWVNAVACVLASSGKEGRASRLAA